MDVINFLKHNARRCNGDVRVRMAKDIDNINEAVR